MLKVYHITLHLFNRVNHHILSPSSYYPLSLVPSFILYILIYILLFKCSIYATHRLIHIARGVF